MVPWLPLYTAQDQGLYKAVGSPDRRVVSLREVLANLACKLRRLVVHVRAWLSSRSCGHIVAWCYMVPLCRPWQHCRHDGGSPAVLCDMISTVVFVIVSWFLGVSYRSWWLSPGRRSPGWLVELRATISIVGVMAPPVWMASKLRLSSWIPSRSG